MTTSHSHKKEDEHKKEIKHKKDDKIFSCTKCNDRFDHLSELKKHQETHKDPLENLKKEILTGVEHEIKEHDKKRLSWSSSFMTTILIVLAFVSIVQTVQSANILSKINSGDFKSSGSKATSVSGSTSTSSPASLDELPQMVGGC